jgi:RNA polymerase sigma factor (sigma-70 family)
MTTSTGKDQRLARLMRSAQDGDAADYNALLQEVAPLVRQAIRGRLAMLQPQDTEDLVQDVLLSLHSARATYDPARPFLPWLLAIVRYRVADGARRYKRRAANEVASDPLPETSAHVEANFPTEGYRDSEQLAQAMAALPPGQRRAIELTKLREMSLQQAAAQTGTSVGALKVAVHRGIGALRKALGAKGGAKD